MKLPSMCQCCGTSFTYDTRLSTGKYCSNRCQQEHQYNTVTLPRIEAGMISERNTLRKYLKKVRGCQCEECSLSEWRGQPLSLELDHIDGNPSNNLPSNIRLLCPNCHSITPTWKGRNKGSGRAARGLPLK